MNNLRFNIEIQDSISEIKIRDSKFSIQINQWDKSHVMLNRSKTTLTYLKGDYS